MEFIGKVNFHAGLFAVPPRTVLSTESVLWNVQKEARARWPERRIEGLQVLDPSQYLSSYSNSHIKYAVRALQDPLYSES